MVGVVSYYFLISYTILRRVLNPLNSLNLQEQLINRYNVACFVINLFPQKHN